MEKHQQNQKDQAYRGIAERKRGALSAAIQEISTQNNRQGGLSFANREKIMKIVVMPLKQLIQKVQDGQLRPEEVRSAFLMRALDVAVESNYLADICDSDIR